MNYRTAPAFYKKEITLMRILIECCKEYDIPVRSISMKNRKHEFVFCRYTYFTISKKLTKHSLSDIGDLVSRDHATVLHGLKEYKKIKELRARTENIKRKFD